jgi:hypothetical protein
MHHWMCNYKRHLSLGLGIPFKRMPYGLDIVHIYCFFAYLVFFNDFSVLNS